jgi:hypothetical protein
MIEIPLTVPVLPRSTFSIELAGVVAAFELRWNSTTSAWYLDARTPAGVDVRLGMKLAVGRPIGWRSLDPRFPLNGWLMLVDTTGAQEDPGFTDLGTRHRLLFVDRSDLPRLPVTVQRVANPRAFVPTDGPDSVYVPQIAAHWEALGIPAPTRQWSTQVASGDLTALIGSGDMIASGGSLLYEQSASGWEQLLVASGSSSQFSASNSAGAGERFAAICYARSGDISGNLFLSLGAGTEAGARANATTTGSGRVELLEDRGGTTTESANNHAGVVRPYLVVAERDLSTQLFHLYTDLEQVDESSSGGAGGAVMGDFRFAAGGSQNSNLRGPVVAYWDGDGVDALESAGMLDEAMLETLGWEIPY